MSALALPRDVQPEWLDELAHDDPRALASRADLRRLNVVMAQRAIMRRLILQALPPHAPRILEIGCGDGLFMAELADGLSRDVPQAELTMLDLKPAMRAKTQARLSARGWPAQVFAADAFNFLRAEGPRYDIVCANLFLHHFKDDMLAELLRLVASRCRAFVACEPRRDRLSLAGSHMVWALGCNDVTRHDAVASVHAGFAGADLSALWPQGAGWSLVEGRAGLFTHAFSAIDTAETFA